MKNANKLLIVLISVAFVPTGLFAQNRELPKIKTQLEKQLKPPSPQIKQQVSAGIVKTTSYEELLSMRQATELPLPAYAKKSGGGNGPTDSFCAPTYTNGCQFGDGFYDFAVEQIQNYGSGCANLNGLGWCEYYNLGPAILSQGMVYTFSMSVGYSNQHVNIWIDFNDDLTLTSDEMILSDFIVATSGTIYYVDVTIPANAAPGQHAMRAMAVWDNSFTDPCGSYFYGEAEDYTVVIMGSFCAPSYTYGCQYGDGFTDFAVEQIQNLGSGCANLNGNGWSQYYNLGPAILTQGNVHTFTMATGYSGQYVDIWIDFNDDLTLTPDEIILNDFYMDANGILYDANVTIPANATLGQHAMRAMAVYYNTFNDPCGSYMYGEAEDYLVMIQMGSFCAPVYYYGCQYGDGFTDFAVEQIQNFGSGCANLNGNGWSKYYNLGPALLTQGNVHTFTMATGFSNQYVNIWIDFNDDLTLTSDEIILNDFYMDLSGVLYDVNVTIPANATLGQHAMRAMDVYYNPFSDPCGSYNYGEAEDYLVIIQMGSFCAPSYTYGCQYGDGFTDFAVEQIQNFGSGCANLNGNGWSKYYNLGPAILTPGNVHTFSMSTGYSGQYVNIWIDFNDDLILTPDEIILNDFYMSSSGVLYDVDVTIPANAAPGQHGMRAMAVYVLTFTDPCGSYFYGEAEDYMVVINEVLYGSIEGYVTANTGGSTLSDAVISVNNGMYTTTSAVNGYYSLTDILPGTWDISCSKTGYNTITSTVTVTAGQTTTMNFAMTAPTIDIFPLTIAVTVDPFGQATEYVNIANNGDGILEWNAQLQIISEDKMVTEVLKGSQAYAVKVYPSPNEVVSFDTDDPGTFTTISSTTLDPFAGDFDNINTSLMYVITYSTNSLYTINVSTGTETFIAPVTGMTSGHNISGMACDKSTGIMYVSSTNISASDIYTVDLNTGALTLIGTTGIPGIIEIAIDGSGTMYAWDIVNDEAFSLNKTTGASILLGPLGVDLNFAQGGNWDPLTDQIYLAAYSTIGQLMTMNKATGALTYIGDFPGGAEVDALAFPGGVNNWISIDPQSGILNPGNSGQMTVSFDATDLLPGVYEAEIHFYTNPDVGSPIVNVTMTVGSFTPPINLDASFICTDVELTWEMPPGANPDSWNIYRDNALIANSTAMSYTDEMVTPEVAYGYYIKAVYAGEESMPTTTEYITVPLPANLAATGLEAIVNTPNENDVTLNWDAPNACLDPEGYNVFRDGILINTTLVTALTYVDPALIPGLFEYNVKAVYYFGESGFSNTAYALITDINEVNAGLFRIFPNPASQMINIESSYEITGIRLINNLGQLILKEELNVHNYQIDVSKLEKGIYYIRLEAGNKKILKKITVN